MNINVNGTFKLSNPEAFEHLLNILDTLSDLKEDLPWCAALDEAIESALFLAHNIQINISEEIEK